MKGFVTCIIFRYVVVVLGFVFLLVGWFGGFVSFGLVFGFAFGFYSEAYF